MNDTFIFSTINKRSNNEDCCIAYGLIVGVRDYRILLLADGMGGHNHGEEYSHAAIEIMASLINRSLLAQAIIPYSNTDKFSLTEEFLHSVVVLTNKQLKEKMLKNGWDTGGTTIAAAIIAENNFHAVSLGDSLIYLWSASESKLYQLTDDHSITGILLKNGAITPEEAKTHAFRNRLRYFIGMDEIPSLDEIDNTAIGKIQENDIIMLCSDGICGVLSTADIEAFFKKYKNIEDLARELIVESRLKGQTDNQTVVIHRFIKKNTDYNASQTDHIAEDSIRLLVKQRIKDML